MTLGRPDQAEQHYEMGSRLLKEAGATPTGELFRAWRGAPGAAAAAPRTQPLRGAAAIRRRAAPASRSVERARGSGAPASRGSSAATPSSTASARCCARRLEQRRCRAVLLLGEPGIGKSRLLDAAAALAREAGAVVLEAAAYEAESIRPFALFVDALRKLEPAAVTAVFDRGDLERTAIGFSSALPSSSPSARARSPSR